MSRQRLKKMIQLLLILKIKLSKLQITYYYHMKKALYFTILFYLAIRRQFQFKKRFWIRMKDAPSGNLILKNEDSEKRSSNGFFSVLKDR